jgi:hypothetical protein
VHKSRGRAVNGKIFDLLTALQHSPSGLLEEVDEIGCRELKTIMSLGIWQTMSREQSFCVEKRIVEVEVRIILFTAHLSVMTSL